MTCILGLEANGRVFMGCDSAAVAGYYTMQQVSEPRKIFKRGNLLFGFTTSFRMGQILQYDVEIPAPDRSKTDIEWLITKLIPEIRTKFKDGGFTEIQNNKELGGQLLVGLRGKVYEISGDFTVLHFREGVAAIGGGYAYALGALSALWPSSSLSPKQAVFRALEITGTFCNGVHPPYHVLSI